MTTGRLGTLLLVATTMAACSDLTEPVSTTEIPREVKEAPAPPAPKPAETAAPAAPAPTAEAQPTVAASHILVAFKDALRAAPTITRSKDEAKARAAQILARAKKGEDFAKLADENS